MTLEKIIELIPEGWFIHAMGERTKRQIYAGDKLDHIDYYVELQHREGGCLTGVARDSLRLALADCIQEVSANATR